MRLFQGLDECRGILKPYYVVVDGKNEQKHLWRQFDDAVLRADIAQTRINGETRQANKTRLEPLEPYRVRVLIVDVHYSKFVY